MPLPFTSNFDLGNVYQLIHDQPTAEPIFMETKQGHAEFVIAATGTAPATITADGHDLPQGNSQEVTLIAGQSLFAKATARTSKITCTGG